jgi:hypothetical protein
MGWHYKSPLAFPALFLTSLREVSACPDEPLVIASGSKAQVAQIAERFRWFKWCIRQEKGTTFDLSAIIDAYDIRTVIREDEVGHTLFLIAKAKKLSEFERLNPDLAGEILPLCQ